MATADELLSRIRYRVDRFRDAGDPAGLLAADQCHAEAHALLSLTGMADGTALHTVAMMHWCRYLALPTGDPGPDRELATRLFDALVAAGYRPPDEFAALRDADPELRRSAHQALTSMPRLGRGGDRAGLEDAIATLGTVAAALPGGHPSRGVLLCARSTAFYTRHQLTGDEADRDRAIESGRDGARLLPAGHPELARYLGNLCTALTARHEAGGAAGDIDEAVRWGTTAFAAAGPGHEFRTRVRAALATALSSRYDRTGGRSDLDFGIALARESAEEPDDGPDRFAVRHNLARMLRSRYELTGSRSDLDEALRWSSAAAESVPGDHPASGAVLAELSWLWWEKSDDAADRSAVDRAIELAEAAVALSPADAAPVNRLFMMRSARAVKYFDRADAVAALDLGRWVAANAPVDGTASLVASLARVIFDTTGEPEFLTDAIDLGRRAAATGGPDALVTLSLSYRDRARVTGSAEDAAEAVRLGERAVAGAVRGAHALAQLSATYRERHELLGDLADVHRAVDTGRQAVAAAAPDDPDRPVCHSHLAAALQARYERTGDPADLDEAVDQGRRSLPGHDAADAGADRFSNLGSALARRHERFGASSDLDDAIGALASAVERTTGAEEARARRLNNLALALGNRWERQGAADDLDRSVAAAEEAVAITPPGNSLRGAFLATLAIGQWRQFGRDGDRRVLDRAVARAREAVAESPPGHGSRPAAVANLATFLETRADSGASSAAHDLDEAIAALESELSGLPADHPHHFSLHLALGNSLRRRHGLDNSPGTVRAALRSWRSVAGSPLAGSPMRLAAARQWGEAAAFLGDLDLAVTGYESAVAQLPLLAWRGIRRDDQEHLLARWGGLAGDAAAAAVRAGHRGRAAELLEHGRGILWAQLLDARTDLARLAAAAPGLAARMDGVRAELDAGAAAPGSATGPYRPTV